MQINRHTYEEFFLLYIDGELNPEEKKAVEEFVEQNPDLQSEFDLVRQSVILPDDSIIFENKELLYKEEDDSRVLPLRWFRFAVAAILLIAFGILGWLYSGDRDFIKRLPVAIVEKPVPVEANQKPGNYSAATPSEQSKVPSEINDEKIKKPGSNKIVSTHLKNIKNTEEKKKIVSENEKENAIDEPLISNNLPERTEFDPRIVKATDAKEKIDVNVKAREIENNYIPEPENNKIYYARMENVQESNNDIIYFANTSLSKKTKLRGVFRKATRFLDKVTSLQ